MLATVVRRARGALTHLAGASPTARQVMARIGRELTAAAGAGPERSHPEGRATGDDLYGGTYFGVGRDPTGDRQGHSGYARYDRVASNADIAAYLLWRNFRARQTLDVGCATGYLVEALAELGIDARGCDASSYAVAHAATGAQGRIEVGDIARGLPYGDGEFDLVSALEILEHLEPEAVPAAVGELRRVCGGVLYATIPSFGRNASGPDGFFEGKVHPDRLDHYRSLGPDYTGPVPREDLATDAEGQPIEGHLTIASFEWWTDRFAEAGFIRRVDLERRLYEDIEPAGLARFWNLYVLEVPGADPGLAVPVGVGSSLPELGLVHPLFEHAERLKAAGSA
jgi:SAM-dependent methyltransferase